MFNSNNKLNDFGFISCYNLMHTKISSFKFLHSDCIKKNCINSSDHIETSNSWSIFHSKFSSSKILALITLIRLEAMFLTIRIYIPIVGNCPIRNIR